MKLIQVLTIALVLWVWSLTPAYPSTWEPILTLVWGVWMPTNETVLIGVRTDHFYTGYCPLHKSPIPTLLAHEILLHEVEPYLIRAGTGREPVATPEPVTVVLLGSGLLGVGIVRRKRR